jgi:BASS family bile acid:Na+ symporter
MMMHWAERLLLALAAAVAMAGMGATLTEGIVRDTLKKPAPLGIGMLCQFGLMPLIAYGLARGFELSPAMAIGLVLVGCSPGGILSNIFTYFSRGNVSLSIAMTAASCLGATLMMPLCLYVYATPFTSSTLEVPYRELLGGLAALLVPAAIGMGVRRRSSAWARRLEKAGSTLGLIVLVYLVATWFPKYGHVLADSSAKEIAACALLSGCGFALAMLLTAAFPLSRRDRGTIVLETGVQNANLALIIITLAFEEPALGRIQWALFLYGLFALIFGITITLLLRRLNAAKEPSALPAAAP